MNGIANELAGQLTVLRVDIFTPVGRELAARYAARSTPTFVFLDGSGREQFRQIGTLDEAAIRAAVSD